MLSREFRRPSSRSAAHRLSCSSRGEHNSDMSLLRSNWRSASLESLGIFEVFTSSADTSKGAGSEVMAGKTPPAISPEV
jgi:hypothetical protein